MSERRSRAWADLESHCADVLQGRRVTIPWDLFVRRVDVAIPDFPNLKVDAKRRKKSAINTLLSECRAKYCTKPGDTPLIVTGVHGDKIGAVASLPLTTLADLLGEVRRLRQVRHVLESKLENTKRLLAEATEKAAAYPETTWPMEREKLAAVLSCLETLEQIATPAPAGKE